MTSKGTSAQSRRRGRGAPSQKRPVSCENAKKVFTSANIVQVLFNAVGRTDIFRLSEACRSIQRASLQGWTDALCVRARKIDASRVQTLQKILLTGNRSLIVAAALDKFGHGNLSWNGSSALRFLRQIAARDASNGRVAAMSCLVVDEEFDPGVRWAAVSVLGSLATKDDRYALEVLVKHLGDSYWCVREAVRLCIDKFAAETWDEELFSIAVRHLDNADREIRSTVAAALIEVGRNDDRPLRLLEDRARMGEAPTRKVALRLLAELSKRGNEAVIAVAKERMNDECADVQKAAEFVLAKQGMFQLTKEALEAQEAHLAEAAEVAKVTGSTVTETALTEECCRSRGSRSDRTG